MRGNYFWPKTTLKSEDEDDLHFLEDRIGNLLWMDIVLKLQPASM